MITNRSGDSTNRTVRARTRIPPQAWLLYTLSVGALIWVFHDFSWRDFLVQLSRMNSWWILPAVAADILSYWCQGVRWQFLIKPAGDLSSLRATQAIYVGLFTNEILPMRLGEAISAFLVARWLQCPLSRVVPSMLVGRLFDGVWLAIAIIGLVFFVHLPTDLEWASDVFAALVAIGVALFVLILLGGVRPIRSSGDVEPSPTGPAPGLVERAAGWMAALIRGVQEIRDPVSITYALIASSGVLIFQALAFWCVMVSYHLPVSVASGLVVFLIVHLGTAIPNTPANVGSYQFFTVLGLSIFGVEKGVAAGFSAVVFVLLTLPLWIIGAAALSRTGLTVAALRSAVRTE